MEKPATITPEEATARGYRRVSNRYGHVSRIDRPDWIEHMAVHLRRAPADFYRRHPEGVGNEPCPTWCDYYRRRLSQDVLVFDPPELARRVPSSGNLECGYVPQPRDPKLRSAIEPFVVKFYVGDDCPTIKGNGFDGLRIGDDREDAEEFVAWLNAMLAVRSAIRGEREE